MGALKDLPSKKEVYRRLKMEKIKQLMSNRKFKGAVVSLIIVSFVVVLYSLVAKVILAGLS
jgi:hypothetical protein